MNIDKLFTSLARIEEQLYTKAVILHHFPRSIQLDYYSCGAKSTYMILKHFGKRCSSDSVEKQLGTDEDGASPNDIKRVLRKYGLSIHLNSKMGLQV
jgi:ABC-type bacteriocin/lantibiotic exporter with double-glycine peptidase domain